MFCITNHRNWWQPYRLQKNINECMGLNPMLKCYCPTGNMKFTSCHYLNFKAVQRFLGLRMTNSKNISHPEHSQRGQCIVLEEVTFTKVQYGLNTYFGTHDKTYINTFIIDGCYPSLKWCDPFLGQCLSCYSSEVTEM